LKRVDEVSEYDALGRRAEVLANRFCAETIDYQYGPHACNRTLARRTVWDGNQELAEFQVQDSTPVVENDEGVVKLGISPTAQDHQDNNPYFGQVLYVHGLTTDQPLAIIRLNYADSSDTLGSPLPYYLRPPTELVPVWNSTGRMDIILSPTGYCLTVGTSKRCPHIARQLGFGAFNNVVELGPESWEGSLLEDKVEQTFTQYRRNRYYDPVTGRFTQPDPIGLAGGINDYGFAAGDPVNYSDPFGLCGEETDKAAQANRTQSNVNCAQRLARDANGLTAEMRDEAANGDAINVTPSVTDVALASLPLGPEAKAGEEIAEVAIGGAIKGFTKHGLNQAISRDGVGVAGEAILDAVRNPVKVVNGAEGAAKYVGKNATVILNKAGQVITTWARNSSGWRIQP
jgi:RHS repeat-associated protein